MTKRELYAQVVRELEGIKNTPAWRHAQALSDEAHRRRLEQRTARSALTGTESGKPPRDVCWL